MTLSDSIESALTEREGEERERRRRIKDTLSVRSDCLTTTRRPQGCNGTKSPHHLTTGRHALRTVPPSLGALFLPFTPSKRTQIDSPPHYQSPRAAGTTTLLGPGDLEAVVPRPIRPDSSSSRTILSENVLFVVGIPLRSVSFIVPGGGTCRRAVGPVLDGGKRQSDDRQPLPRTR